MDVDPRERRRNVICGAALAATLLAVLLAWFGRACWGGWWVADDSPWADTYMLGRIYESWAAQVAGGHLPLWFREFAAGYPVHASWMYGLFYPPLAIFLALPVEAAWTWNAIFHVVFGALGMYALLLDERRDRAAAAAGAIVFAFSGFMLGRVLCGHVNLVMPFAWTPWVLLQALRTVRGEPRATAWFAIATGLGLLAGHVQIWFYAGPLVAAYAVFEARQRRVMAAAAKRLAIGAALALGIAAIQWIPAWELFTVSGHPQENPLGIEMCSLPLQGLVNQIAPRYAESAEPFRHEHLGLAGPLAAGAALLAFRLRDKRRWFWFAVLVFGVLLAMGTRNPVSRLANELPPFRFARAPGRAMTLVVLAGSVLAGHLVADWTRNAGALLRTLVPAAFLASTLVFGVPAPRAVRADFWNFDWSKLMPPQTRNHRVHVAAGRYPYFERFGVPTLRDVCPLDTPGYKALTTGAKPAPARVVAWWLDVATEIDVRWDGPPESLEATEEMAKKASRRPFEPGGAGNTYPHAEAVTDDVAFARLAAGERALFVPPGTDVGTASTAAPSAVEPRDSGAPDAIEFTTGDQWTVLSAKWYPGWEEERGAPVVRGNLALLAVRTAAVTSPTCRLRYRPWWRWPALAASSASLLTAAWLLRRRPASG